jgi:hypothetical protein
MEEYSAFVTDALQNFSNASCGAHWEAGGRFDANDTVFFARQLEFIEPTFYQFDLKVLKHRAYIPVDNSADPGADNVTYRIFEKIGVAVIINNFANDLPRADIVGSEHTNPVRSVGASFGFSVQELRRARLGNTPLESMKVDSAQRAMNEKESSIAWSGDSSFGLPGLLGNANIPSQQALASASGTNTRQWDGVDKTSAEITSDIRLGVSAVRNATKGARQVDTFLVPEPQFSKLAMTRMETGTDTTILQFLSKPGNSFGFDAIDWVFELAGAFSGNDGAFLYQRKPEVLQQRIPMERIIHPMQRRNLEFISDVEARNGGVVVRFPLAGVFITEV